MERRRDRRTSNSTRNQMEVQPPATPHIWSVWERLVRSGKKATYAVCGNRSVTEEVLSTTMCVVEQTLNARRLTSVSSDVNDLEALTPITFCLATRTFPYPIYHAQKNLWIIENSSDRHKPMQFSYGTDFVKNICKLWIIGKNGDLRANETLKKSVLVWLIEDSHMRGYYNLGRISKTIGWSDGLIRSAKVRTNDGVYKKTGVKLAPVLHGKDVFAMEMGPAMWRLSLLIQ